MLSFVDFVDFTHSNRMAIMQNFIKKITTVKENLNITTK